jgi:small conductance mechanosensitive channel
VKRIIGEVLSADDRILEDPAPTVGLVELADSSVNFAVRPWVKSADYWDVYFDLNETVKKRFDAAGISIPFPQRDVHVSGGSANAA